MEKVKPRTLSGFMELLPAPQVQMERIMQVLRETYALYGFYPLDTPLIESSEVLLAKGGGETEKQIYRFTKGDSDLSLRFDLTVPLAKYVAQHYGELTFPFRRFQIGKVYRGERAQRGRFREFYQADIDVIGDGKLDIINEAEVPSIIYKTFTSLGLERFKIRINNRKVLNGFFAILGLTEKAGDVMRTIDKLEKIGAEKVKAILVDDFGVAAATADELLAFIQTPGGTEGILAAPEGYKGRIEVYVPEEIFKDFKKKGIPAQCVYVTDGEGNRFAPELTENQFVILRADQSVKKTHLGRVENGVIRKLEYKKSAPYGIHPRNAGQYFLQEALMQPAKTAPLVIVKGMAGTSKTFYSLAVGLEKVLNNPTGEYRRILVCRPNAQFDSDIGFLPGVE